MGRLLIAMLMMMCQTGVLIGILVYHTNHSLERGIGFYITAHKAILILLKRILKGRHMVIRILTIRLMMLELKVRRLAEVIYLMLDTLKCGRIQMVIKSLMTITLSQKSLMTVKYIDLRITRWVMHQ